MAEVKASGDSVWPGSTGNTYRLHNPISTDMGLLKLIRVRIYDESKVVFRGHPDYAVNNKEFSKFKKVILTQANTKLIQRPEYEMVEIWDEEYEVAIYFPSVPLTKDVEKKLLGKS